MKQIETFLQYIRYELNYSVHTVLSYRKDLLQFADYVGRGGEDDDLSDLGLPEIRGWVYDLGKNRHLAVSSVRRKVQSLRAFYRYLLKRGLVEANPVEDLPLAKQPRRLPVFLREKSLDEVLDAPLDADSFTEVRDRLVVMMFYETGIRRAELVGIKNSDINTKNRELKVHGKRNKDRIVPFCDELGELIERYRTLREAYEPVEDDVLFLTDKGAPIYTGKVYGIVRDALSPVTQGKRSPHTLRHSFASAMLNHGAGINSVKELLGHESLSATQIYTHITYSELKNNYQHAHPRALKKGG